MDIQRFRQLNEQAKLLADEIGNLLIEIFHYLALFVIGASIVWSAVVAYGGMMLQGHATIGDILLLFIYLELGAMVGIYFKTNLMPVRCLIYIAITALARLLIADIQAHHQADMGILLVSGGILLLALSTVIIRKPSDDT
ncbi:phosphate-starvation-inducible PsiE family protein [Methylomonas sp. EFPC1]|uniref:phosphate-starvation-inducible protein PsiE n=1 Tax=unclassified Methylomonas TaxID=2608980 RepID=UPI00149279A8|nr:MULTISPECIES: phosphate-starvation-inducible PsiE family protein [unclassified Methylomonas]NOV32320.1 phosphate-starvation-inducible E [Methylomonas sp. ZR1]QSB00893.1 phosphate-starvation-inducible PsiE family protein [Methylomonas sp. EFPC1]